MPTPRPSARTAAVRRGAALIGALAAVGGVAAGVSAAGAQPAPAPSTAAPAAPAPPLGVTGTVRFHGAFPSRHVAARHVEVWLPPGYARDAGTRYPVLYMHDGQNVFAPATSYTGLDWAVDETMTRLVAERRVRPAIVVAVWNTPARFFEYMPRRALDHLADSVRGMPQTRAQTDSVRSDAYLRFLVAELKPFVDRTYRTRPGRADTFVMGSSMGGLISAYALAEYPAVFGGAGCVSTHWPAGDGVMIEYLRRQLPPPAGHRLYFDHGTATLDSLYAPYQRRADAVMRAAGYVEGRNWVTRVFPGAEHSERAWRARVEEPLVFLLGR
jgi:predicted alpha/beta superfamily hydrolase